jgi:hypothetical protein
VRGGNYRLAAATNECMKIMVKFKVCMKHARTHTEKERIGGGGKRIRTRLRRKRYMYIFASSWSGGCCSPTWTRSVALLVWFDLI